MSAQRYKLDLASGYVDTAIQRSRHQSDQLTLATTLLSAGVVALFCAVLPTTSAPLGARLLFVSLVVLHVASAASVVLIVDPSMRTGTTDPARVVSDLTAEDRSDVQASAEYLLLVIEEFVRHRRATRTQTVRASVAALCGAAAITVGVVLTLV